jgi:hypothetical protein
MTHSRRPENAIRKEQYKFSYKSTIFIIELTALIMALNGLHFLMVINLNYKSGNTLYIVQLRVSTCSRKILKILA